MYTRWTHEMLSDYYRVNPSGHYFDADTMRFFKSRIGQAAKVGDVWFFVTSERCDWGDGYPRMYTLRAFRVGQWEQGSRKGTIRDLTSFQQFDTGGKANTRLRRAVGLARKLLTA